MQTKKEFLYTICAGARNLDFPGKTELVDTITRAWKTYENLRKKRVYAHDTRAGEYQDILDTLKRGLLKNTNIRGLYWKLLIIANVIRHIGRVVKQIGRTPGRQYPEISESLKERIRQQDCILSDMQT